MANKVTVQVVGGSSKTFDNVATIGDVKRLMNVGRHTATINGDTAGDEARLGDYNFVHLAPPVKGGNK